MDLDRKADANYRANHRPDGTGAHSMETEDNGHPDTDPWTASQLDEIIAWFLWEHETYGIPLVLCPRWDAPGIGYHVLFPHDWTNVRGKTCPGRVRIEQFHDVILPAVTAGNGHAPPTPDPEEFAMDAEARKEFETLRQMISFMQAQLVNLDKRLVTIERPPPAESRLNVDPSALFNYGVASIVLALFLVWAQREHDRVVRERDRVWDRSDSLVDEIHGDLSEAIQEATRAIKARGDFEDQVYDLLVDVRRLLEGREQ